MPSTCAVQDSEKTWGDHLQQGGPSVAAILGPGGPCIHGNKNFHKWSGGTSCGGGPSACGVTHCFDGTSFVFVQSTLVVILPVEVLASVFFSFLATRDKVRIPGGPTRFVHGCQDSEIIDQKLRLLFR